MYTDTLSKEAMESQYETIVNIVCYVKNQFRDVMCQNQVTASNNSTLYTAWKDFSWFCCWHVECV